MSIYILIVYVKLSMQFRRDISARFPNNSDAEAKENLEEMFTGH